MDEKELKDIIAKHELWLDNDSTAGERANLRGADLRLANLIGTDLRWADLGEADLRGAKLGGADLRGANLYGANLRGANLRETDLRETDLRETNLYRVNLYGADLYGADLIVLNLPFYTAYIQRDNTRIGCKYLSNQEWAGLSDDEIAKMDSNALEFWTAYKSIIFAAMDSLMMAKESK